MLKFNEFTGSWSHVDVASQAGSRKKVGVDEVLEGRFFESALERDFLHWLQFDQNISTYTPRPITIDFRGSDKVPRKHTPSGLIEWRVDRTLGDYRPVLVELQSRAVFEGAWRPWRERVRALQEYASDRGWRFQLYTERDICQITLKNIRFLLPYLGRSEAPEIRAQLLAGINDLVEATPMDLLSSLYPDKWDQAEALAVLWQLLADQTVDFDSRRPLTMQSAVWQGDLR